MAQQKLEPINNAEALSNEEILSTIETLEPKLTSSLGALAARASARVILMLTAWNELKKKEWEGSTTYALADLWGRIESVRALLVNEAASSTQSISKERARSALNGSQAALFDVLKECTLAGLGERYFPAIQYLAA